MPVVPSQSLDDHAADLAQGRTTSRALVEACLARIADPAGEGARAFVRVYADQARASADAMDRLRQANRAPGPFAGIPISLKDLFDVAGEVTSAGSVVLARAPPAAAHAPVVQRLLSAGLVPVGRTNMTEFAFSGIGINPHHGTPRAPWDREVGRVPGGSSSGAAVSVADGMAAGGIGTDTGGSCRIPAAFCGIAGFKPTQRRVPRDGVLPLAPSLDSVGSLGATASCCAVLDAIMAGERVEKLAVPRTAGLRLVMPNNVVLDGMDAATERAMDRAVHRLDRAGVVIEHRRLRAFDAIVRSHRLGSLAVAESYEWHRALLAGEASRYDPRVAARILPGAQMRAADYIALAEARRQAIAIFEVELGDCDALIMPTVPIGPPPISAFGDEAEYRRLNALILRNAAQINFLDGCAISLPCTEREEPPAGLTLALPGMEDRRLLQAASALEPLLTLSRQGIGSRPDI